ncbi:hypothetical protein BaOVIS_030020 [Babesia ovis]|uniref:Uncharacterized protein n=1 Tax=Babesia ovis TaxID=5869 RepID=A0A9W5TD39_BABOV|nr:hypothetical protein BaOVIS_030020 [Babesia ovis]
MDRPVHLTVLSQPSIAYSQLLWAVMNHDGLTVATLPMDFSLLRTRLANCPSSSHEKHVVDNWRSLLVEANTDVLLTTAEYYPLISPVCRELAIPVYVLTDAPSILTAEEFTGATRAGHGYFDYINRPKKEIKCFSGASSLLRTSNVSQSMLHVFSEIGSCNSKVVIHTAATLKSELDRIRGLFQLASDDCVLNCLFPHDYSSTVHCMIHACEVGAKVYFPLRVTPSSRYSSLKLQFPLTAPRNLCDTVKLYMAQSVFEFVRSQKLRPDVLLCGSDIFRLLLSFLTCDDISTAERSSYTAFWHNLNRIYIFDDVRELFGTPLHDVTQAFLETISVSADATQIYTLPEVGAVAYVDLRHRTCAPKPLPGCDIIEGDTEFEICARTDSVFKAYLGRTNATNAVMKEGVLHMSFPKRLAATRLLSRHLDYVRYFKRRRERMARYPQGFIKQVPVRTQFWGNFTGRHRHHSVL